MIAEATVERDSPLDGLLVVPHPLRGWKVLLRDDEPRHVYSLYTCLGRLSFRWTPGEWHQAECWRMASHYFHEPHEPTPARGCTCGFYAYTTREALLRGWPAFGPTHIVALVEGAGRIVLHDDGGWRAEFMRLVAIWPGHKWVERMYHVLARR